MASTEPFVTLATFTYPTELAVVQGRLESEGIPCQVVDLYTAQVHNFYSNAIGGIKLQVLQHDLERARDILVENGTLSEEEIEPDGLTVGVARAVQWLRSPNHKRQRLVVLGVAALIVLSLLAIARW